VIKESIEKNNKQNKEKILMTREKASKNRKERALTIQRRRV